MIELKEKEILDACCGGKMMWFDKNEPRTVYADKRKEQHILCDGRVLEISPDIQLDFCQMPFPDSSFSLVVFDPPHLEKLGENTWLAQKYGKLLPTWKEDIKEGFNECMRVLKPNGVLIFKWNENQIKVKQILELIPFKPLFGHPTAKHGKTIWVTFMK